MSNKGAQTIVADPQDMLNGTLPGPRIDASPSIAASTTTTTTTSSSHPPPVHCRPYNIQRRIRQNNGHANGRGNHSPSIRQSWLFPTNRASPSTASETTSVIARSQRPPSVRIEAPSSTSSSATAQSVPPVVTMNHKERRIFSGSARTRLHNIDRMSKMLLNPNAPAPNLLDGPQGFPNPTAPRRARLSLQPAVPVTETLPSSVMATNPSNLPQRTLSTSTTPHTPSSNNYPRHIIVPSTSHHNIEDQLDNGTTDPLSSSLPSSSGFAPGVDTLYNSEYTTTSNSEKSNKHSSMPLPRPGWRLYDLPDHEEPELQHGQGDGSCNNGEERNNFQYSTSNASSTTNLDNHPYAYHAHTRQDSTSTCYTATPNASALDLSSGSGAADPSSMYSPESNLGQAQSPGSFALLPPLPKIVKNTKSPLALRRSSTISSAISSSPSSMFINKGSFPKSSLSSNGTHSSKTLTLERQKIILEILKTERSYVDGLIILQTCFYEPLNAPYATGSNPGMNTATSANLVGGNTTFGSGTGAASLSPHYASSTMGSNSTLSASAAPLLSKKSVGMIFSNFSEILQINIELLTQLENRICGSTLSTGWESDVEEVDEEGCHQGDEGQGSPSTQQADEQKPKQVWVTVGGQGGEQEELLVLDMDWCVGDIFIEIAPFLKMYSNYVKAFESALTHVNECMKSSDRFTEFLKTTARRPECKNLDFQAYFMLPIQRIPRYKLLLESLLRHTPSNHPDHRKLQIAFESMEQTAGFVNETIRQHEMFGEMINLQSKITGMSEPLVVPGRVLLKRGRVWKVCRRNIQLREIILLSDCILWTSPSMNPLEDTLTFHRKVGLENCTVIGAEDPDPTKNAFQIMSSEKSSQVFVDTAKEKEDWIAAIRIATQEYFSAKRTLKPTPTPLENLTSITTGFGLLRRETVLRSPTFGNDSRANTFSIPMCIDPEVAGDGIGTLPSLDNRYQSEKRQQQPLRVVENYNAPVWTILIKGTTSEKLGRACDDCFDAMPPEEVNMIDSGISTTGSPESSPVGQQHQQPRGANSNHERHASSQSLDGIMIRSEDYSQESNPSGGATGMVRGFVEAGLSRMKSRSNQPVNQDSNTNDTNPKENTRGSNRNSIDYQNAAHVKECGLCKTEFSMFKWRNICSQCRRVVCSDCLTKKQIDQLFLLGLQAEREAKARGIDISAEDAIASLALQNSSSETQDGLAAPGIPQGASESAAEAGTNDGAARPAAAPRSQSFNSDTNNNNNGGYGSFGNGWQRIRGNTDSGHGQAEKLCDPCYLGLSADQIKVLESGGGWQYYQATLGKHHAPGLAAALALSNMSLDDDDGNGNGQQTED
ncbi:hypothetical protein BGZ79_009775 [Entomortierella chlamydospora]|nr:hypothetical protein BGZ79_009775 [Entomortierella chlamydospora]